MYESSPTETNQKKDKKEQIMKKIRQLENQQKILLNRQSDMERRARTRRLIEHGAILESVFPALAALPGEEVKAFLLALSRLPEAAELLKKTKRRSNRRIPKAHLCTSSGQAPYSSFRRKRQNSSIPLPLLSPQSLETLQGPH